MTAKLENLGLYNIDVNYLEYLHSIDSEVQFSLEKDYSQKPFLGILVLVDTYTYFIPLTSAKPKHASWTNVGPVHYLIYERVLKTELHRKDVFKSISDTEALKILAALDLKKMIPVRDGLYNKIEFASMSDHRYAALLEKEYRFCLGIWNGIASKAGAIYSEQKETGRVYPMYCNFSKLEEACNNY